jgi:cytochrome c nitrite reductase small subunit
MSGKSKATLLLILVIGAMALVGTAIPLTDHPTFCAGCHTIAPAYGHVRPGVQGWLSDKVLAGVRDATIYIFGTPTDAHNLKAKVASEVCLSCHRHILRVSETAPRDLPSPVKEVGLVMNHRQHMEAFKARGQDEGCTTCHAGVVHDEPIKGYPIVIPRGHVSTDSQPWYPTHPEGSYLRARALGDCFRCHDGKAQHGGKTLDRKCETCHISEKISGSLLFN